MKLRLALAAVLLSSVPAFAADLAPQPVEPAAPVVAPVYNWTGFYAGIDAGAIFGQAKANVIGINNHQSYNSTGFIGGAHAGYNAQFDGGFVVGLETDFNFSTLSKTSNAVIDGVGLTSKFKNDWQGSTRARLGYAIDNILPYITGGVAYGDQKWTVALGGIGNAKISDSRVGWTIGGGVEYGITQNWIARGEVRYTDYGQDSTNVQGVNVKTKFDNITTTLGTSYKF
jgi:outer membrane immunogenic protein